MCQSLQSSRFIEEEWLKYFLTPGSAALQLSIINTSTDLQSEENVDN